MRKFTIIFLCLILTSGILSSCKSTTSTSINTDDDTCRLSIVTTIFPEYDWVREILGDTDVDLKLLIGNGVDLHSYQPTVDDILCISTCDLFIYLGGESDEWVEDALSEATNKDMLVLNLLDILGDAVVEEETVEGMEAEDDEEDDEDDDDEIEYDEHVWLSLKRACIICDAITEALCELDGAQSAYYSSNNSSYQAKLLELDEQYASLCENATKDTLLFGDRFPFRYLVDDYNLSYYAAFNGCSAETEASFETIIFLAEKVDELGLSCVLTIETSDGKIAETIVANTTNKDQQILVLNSMQAISTDDIENGASYLELANENLEILKEALQ